jgi:hypothetical protein
MIKKHGGLYAQHVRGKSRPAHAKEQIQIQMPQGDILFHEVLQQH